MPNDLAQRHQTEQDTITAAWEAERLAAYDCAIALPREIADLECDEDGDVILGADENGRNDLPELHTEGQRRGMYCFALPVEIPAVTLSMLWHPRMDGDLAHRWLRTCLRSVCSTKRG